MMQHLIDATTHFIDVLGYPGVFFLMLLESACIPVPSMVVQPFAGALIVLEPTKGYSLWGLTLAGTLGNLAGSMIAYWVGMVGGRPFLHKYGRYFLVREADIDAGDRAFRKHGNVISFVTRLLPVVRTFISLPAGIARMPFKQFCVYTFIGCIPYCWALTWAGYKAGQHWTQLHAVLRKADLAMVVLLVLGIAFWLYHHLRPEHAKPAEAESEANVD